MSAIVLLYVSLITKGRKTLAKVPENIRPQVEEALADTTE